MMESKKKTTKSDVSAVTNDSGISEETYDAYYSELYEFPDDKNTESNQPGEKTSSRGRTRVKRKHRSRVHGSEKSGSKTHDEEEKQENGVLDTSLESNTNNSDNQPAVHSKHSSRRRHRTKESRTEKAQEQLTSVPEEALYNEVESPSPNDANELDTDNNKEKETAQEQLTSVPEEALYNEVESPPPNNANELDTDNTKEEETAQEQLTFVPEKAFDNNVESLTPNDANEFDANNNEEEEISNEISHENEENITSNNINDSNVNNNEETEEPEVETYGATKTRRKHRRKHHKSRSNKETVYDEYEDPESAYTDNVPKNEKKTSSKSTATSSVNTTEQKNQATTSKSHHDTKPKVESKTTTQKNTSNVASSGWDAAKVNYNLDRDMEETAKLFTAPSAVSTISAPKQSKSFFKKKEKNTDMVLNSIYATSQTNLAASKDKQEGTPLSRMQKAKSLFSLFKKKPGKDNDMRQQPAGDYGRSIEPAPQQPAYQPNNNYQSAPDHYKSANITSRPFAVEQEQFRTEIIDTHSDDEFDEEAKLLEVETKYTKFFEEALRSRPDELSHDITCVLEFIVQFYVERKKFDFLQQEFNSINKMQADYTRCLIATHKLNKTLNADRNFVPYDSNRVKILDPNCLINKTDYICASFIRDPILESTFIVAQSPLRETIEAFWVMIYEQKCRQIFCLDTNTDERDAGIQYYPDEGSMFQYMLFSVRLEFLNTQPNFVERIVVIKPYDLSKPPLIVNHFTANRNYEKTDMYEGLNHLLYLASLKYFQSNRHPITVHFKGGFGLPAVFVASVIIQYQIRSARLFSPLITAHILRYQLMNCFKNGLHYRMLYELTADFVSAATSLERYKFNLNR